MRNLWLIAVTASFRLPAPFLATSSSYPSPVTRAAAPVGDFSPRVSAPPPAAARALPRSSAVACGAALAVAVVAAAPRPPAPAARAASRSLRRAKSSSPLREPLGLPRPRGCRGPVGHPRLPGIFPSLGGLEQRAARGSRLRMALDGGGSALKIHDLDVWAGSSPLIEGVTWTIMPNERWSACLFQDFPD